MDDEYDDDEFDFDDARVIPEVQFPSYVPSSASGMPGDLDADDPEAAEAMIIKPNWKTSDLSNLAFVDGIWEAPTRGGGATQTEAEETPAAEDTEEIHGGGEGKDYATKACALGIFSGNLGEVVGKIAY